MRTSVNVQPGQRVITTGGVARTVAFTSRGVVYVFGQRGLPEPARVRYDALGGEAGTSNECDESVGSVQEFNTLAA